MPRYTHIEFPFPFGEPPPPKKTVNSSVNRHYRSATDKDTLTAQCNLTFLPFVAVESTEAHKQPLGLIIVLDRE